jgi:hypothetical protein
VTACGYVDRRIIRRYATKYRRIDCCKNLKHEDDDDDDDNNNNNTTNNNNNIPSGLVRRKELFIGRVSFHCFSKR